MVTMYRVPPHELESFVTDLLTRFDLPDGDARAVSSSLVTADLRGHHSHGVRLLPRKYAPELDDGTIDPRAESEVQVDGGGSTAVIDGNRCFGHLAARHAVGRLAGAVDDTGLGCVGVRNVSHIGRIGEWAERATDAGVAFMALVCNPGTAWVAPPGSVDRRLSTNPVSIGFPSFGALDFPLVVDVATSQAARGKISYHEAMDDAIPEGWVRAAGGEWITDPKRYLDGAGVLLPLGGTVTGHKGFGLGVLVELLASSFANWDVSGGEDVRGGNTAVFIGLDPTLNATPSNLRRRISAFADYLYDSTTRPGTSSDSPGPARPLLPGEYEHRSARRQLDEGVELPERDVEALRSLATAVDAGGAVPDVLR